jgi:predicted Zn finger-like uncharacterized protein
MSIAVKCPGCGAKYKVADSAAGKAVRCKNAECGTQIPIPKPAAPDSDFFEVTEAVDDVDQPAIPAPQKRRQSAVAASREPSTGSMTKSQISTAALTSLILGICSFGCTLLTGIPAIIFGIVALVKIDRSRGQLRGTALAITGICLGFFIPVVVAAVLAALLWPAVQAARNAARATESKNHLKSIGLALANYSDTFGSFPPGAIVDAAQREHHGWQVMLLPYLDQQAVYVQVNFKVPWNAPENVKPFQMQIKDFQLPGVDETKDSAGYALSHYAGNSYVFRENAGASYREIADGTSTTIMAGEAAGNFKPWGSPENRRDPSNGIQAGPDSYGSPGSPGAVFLFCDGSVRYLSKAVNPDVLKAFATPAGGEIITQGGTDAEISVVVPTSPPPSQPAPQATPSTSPPNTTPPNADASRPRRTLGTNRPQPRRIRRPPLQRPKPDAPPSDSPSSDPPSSDPPTK